MDKKDDFLLEIFTEELPPKSLKTLSESLGDEIKQELDKLELKYEDVKLFAAPRRLAVLVESLALKQPDQNIEKQGPSVEKAFDKEGKPTKACVGFAATCGVGVKELKEIKTAKGTFLYFSEKKEGKTVFDLLPDSIKRAISNLHIERNMHWGSNSVMFVRPVHSVIMLYGKKVISTEILGVKTSNTTEGHRFHCSKKMIIPSPRDYVRVLKNKGIVIADFKERKEIIREELLKISKKQKSHVLIEEDLLEEVTSMVSYPFPLLATFKKEFLKIPKEALILFMEKHQRGFPFFNETGKLEPFFVTISNIKSKKPSEVIKGNERVMQARLSDAKFFYENDLRLRLKERVKDLKHIVFQTKLGTLFDKIQRLIKLSSFLAGKIGANVMDAERAAFLSKTDLVSDMVKEFPDLQGIMGKYYALQDGEDSSVATALNEQYMPRHSQDCLPETKIGQVLAIADRIDTLVGIFGINKKPTGDKDPFGLRRAAIGLVRIITEQEKPLSIDLLELLSKAKEIYGEVLINKEVVENVFSFVQDRLKAFLMEKGFLIDEINAVSANDIASLSDFVKRVRAVKAFRKLKEAESLAMANKRVTNLLSKESVSLVYQEVDESLLKESPEIELKKLIDEKKESTKLLYQKGKYEELLIDLATLRSPIDEFFDKVMVMVDDERLCKNRLTLLAKLKGLFLQVADISLLK